jgi:hypothetical protein
MKVSVSLKCDGELASKSFNLAEQGGGDKHQGPSDNHGGSERMTISTRKYGNTQRTNARLRGRATGFLTFLVFSTTLVVGETAFAECDHHLVLQNAQNAAGMVILQVRGKKAGGNRKTLFSGKATLDAGDELDSRKATALAPLRVKVRCRKDYHRYYVRFYCPNSPLSSAENPFNKSGRFGIATKAGILEGSPNSTLWQIKLTCDGEWDWASVDPAGV